MQSINRIFEGYSSKTLLAFLTPREFCQLMLASRTLYRKLKEQEGVLVKQFLDQLVRNQDDLIMGIYRNSSYPAMLRTSNEIYQRNSMISQHFKEFCSAKYQFGEFLQLFPLAGNTQEVICKINKVLLKPMLMPLPIKRDHQSCETFSLFQNHLNDASHSLNLEAQTIETYEEIARFDPMMLSVENQTEYNSLIFRAYWLMEEDQQTLAKQSPTPGEGMRVPPFLTAYFFINRIFTSYCKLMADYLAGVSDPFVFISEYACKWNNFVLSMQAIGGYLREFSQTMNQLYDERFKEYPRYPGFSIWRMMTKIWYSEVFGIFEAKLLKSFKAVFAVYLNTFNSQLQSPENSPIASHLNKEYDFTQVASSTMDFDQEDIEHCLRMLWNSAVDLAVHELSVAELTFSSELKVASPTSKLFAGVQELLAARWQLITQRSDLKTGQKFEILKTEGSLIEMIIPPTIFHEIYLALAKTQQEVLVDFFSQTSITASNQDIIDFITTEFGKKNKEITRWLGTDEATLSYSELLRHIDSWKSYWENLQFMVEHRAKRKQGVRGPEIIDLQKRLLDLQGKIDMELLEHCREYLKSRAN